MRKECTYCFVFLLGFLIATIANAQEEKKPVAAKGAGPAPESKSSQIGMLIEYFEVDHRTANKLVSKFSPRAADAQELRDTLGEMMKRGEATLVETAWLRALSGQRAKTESVEENIYATEFDPPEIPNTVGGSGKVDTGEKKAKVAGAPSVKEQFAGEIESSLPIHMTSATPTAFETQNIGLTFEVDPVLSNDKTVVHINANPQLVSRHEDIFYTRPEFEDTAWGIDHVFMPTFHRMSLQIITETIAGNYNLVGLHSPPQKPDKRILCLLKVNVYQN